ncbi:hypothetical protein [Ralstonia syzygii]|uniref:hypothetical protein n=1 Tax=Ralstonia syzygii TaxID=28097 RepID=UPI001BAA3826|nr:hypothetical protein [Ralstonia syzygii]
MKASTVVRPGNAGRDANATGAPAGYIAEASNGCRKPLAWSPMLKGLVSAGGLANRSAHSIKDAYQMHQYIRGKAAHLRTRLCDHQDISIRGDGRRRAVPMRRLPD